MDGIDILKMIIANDGDCGWLNRYSYRAIQCCEQCPLAYLKVDKDGRFLSCIEAVVQGAYSMSEADQNIKYKAIAEKLLIDHTVEGILKEDNGTGS